MPTRSVRVLNRGPLGDSSFLQVDESQAAQTENGLNLSPLSSPRLIPLTVSTSSHLTRAMTETVLKLKPVLKLKS